MVIIEVLKEDLTSDFLILALNHKIILIFKIELIEIPNSSSHGFLSVFVLQFF